MVQQGIQSEQLALLVNALCSDAVRGVDQEPAQQQLLAVIFNTITLAGQYICPLSEQIICVQVCQATAYPCIFLVSADVPKHGACFCSVQVTGHHTWLVFVYLNTQSASCMNAGSACSSVSQQLWLLLLQLQAVDRSPTLASQAAAASDCLAAACALSSSANLAAMHAPALINDVTQVSMHH